MLFQSYVLVLQQKVYHKNQQLQGCPVPRWCRSFTSAAQGDGVILLGFQILCWHSAWGCTTWIYDTYWYMLIPWSGCLKVNISLVGIDCLHWRHTSWRQPQGYCSLHFTRNFLLLKGFQVALLFVVHPGSLNKTREERRQSQLPEIAHRITRWTECFSTFKCIKLKGYISNLNPWWIMGSTTHPVGARVYVSIISSQF